MAAPGSRCDCTMHPGVTQHLAIARGWHLFAPGRAVVLVLAAVTLAACSGGQADEAFERYLARLCRTLSVESVAIEAAPVAALPAPRDLHLEISAGNLDMLDFLALSGCAVQVTIGKRNSSLGRMARDSQSLLLDLEYLQLAPACIDYQREQGESGLADALEQAWELKRRQLPAAVYNATLGSREYREFWKTPAYPTTDYPANTSSAVIASLEAVNGHARRWLAGDFSADNQEFEILLGEVATGDGGALLQALAAQNAALAAANRVLVMRMERGALCSPTTRPAAADILSNVIRKYFIAGIQPRAADLNRRFHQLLPAVRTLEQLLEDSVPPAYRAWRSRRDAELEGWILAPRSHVAELQAIQRPCDSGQAPAQRDIQV